MKLRLLLIVLAMALGLAAAFTAVSYTNKIKKSVNAGTTPVAVIVADHGLPTGLSLKELRSRKLAVLKKVPKQFVPDGAVKADTDLGEKVLAVDINEGEVLTINKFKSAKSLGLASLTPGDRIAVAFSSEEMRAVGYLVKVGDHVNVIGTMEKNDVIVTKTLITNTQVLAVGPNLDTNAAQKPSGEKNEIKSVTIAATQGEAEQVVTFDENGSVWLTLVPREKWAEASSEFSPLSAKEDSTDDASGDAGSKAGGAK